AANSPPPLRVTSALQILPFRPGCRRAVLPVREARDAVSIRYPGASLGVRACTAEAPQSWARPSLPVQQTSPQISPMARNFHASCRRVRECSIALKAAGTVADILAG